MDRDRRSPLIITSVAMAIRARSQRCRSSPNACALPVVAHNAARRDAAVEPPDACRLRFRTAGAARPISSSVPNATCRGIRISTQPTNGCKVAHIGEDPVYQRYPMRSFQSDLSIAARRRMLAKRCIRAGEASAGDGVRIEARRKCSPSAARRARDKSPRKRAAPPTKSRRPISATASAKRFGTDAVIFNEYPLSLEHCPRDKPRPSIRSAPAGGLGWGLGAAIGAKLAAPEKLIVATLGDGSYMFANPTVGHWMQQQIQAADPVDHLQQQPLWRGAPGHAVDVQGRRRRRERRPLPRRSRSVSAVRRIRDGAGRTWRARRAPRGCAGCAGTRTRRRHEGKKQALLNVITPY